MNIVVQCVVDLCDERDTFTLIVSCIVNMNDYRNMKSLSCNDMSPKKVGDFFSIRRVSSSSPSSDGDWLFHLTKDEKKTPCESGETNRETPVTII